MPDLPVDFRCTLGVFSPGFEDRKYPGVPRGSITMLKIWLIAVMVVLALIAVDITVRIGWDRFSSGIGSLVGEYWYVKQVSPASAQPGTTPPRLEPAPPPRGARPGEPPHPRVRAAIRTLPGGTVSSASNDGCQI